MLHDMWRFTELVLRAIYQVLRLFQLLFWPCFHSEKPIIFFLLMSKLIKSAYGFSRRIPNCRTLKSMHVQHSLLSLKGSSGWCASRHPVSWHVACQRRTFTRTLTLFSNPKDVRRLISEQWAAQGFLALDSARVQTQGSGGHESKKKPHS